MLWKDDTKMMKNEGLKDFMIWDFLFRLVLKAMQLFNLLGRDCEQDGASARAQDFGELCANFKAVIRPQL